MPPAPGVRPRPTSGREITVSGRATTRPAKAASSMPAPMQAPWRRASTRGPSSARSRAGLRVRRIRWAVAGSGSVPNSARSPPLQNDGPAPSSTTRSIEGSAEATSSASTSWSRSAVFTALCRLGRDNVTCSSAPLLSTTTAGPASDPGPPPGAVARQRANSEPAWSIE